VKVAEKIRQIYERRPYPFGNAKALKGRTWALGIEWINAIGRVGARTHPPARVLLAGCGDGTEAFNMRRQFPHAHVVGVDFCRRSIAVARRLQRRDPILRGIRFVVGDLADPRLPARLGGPFDLVVCHGVFSYIPRAARAMANFARCLKPDGVLYLGVNGATHVNRRLRPALAGFGYDLSDYEDSPRLRRVLKLCDSVVSADGFPRVSGHGPEFLAGDVFGALNRSLPLARWVALGRGAGLHFRGNLAAIRLFRRIAENDLDPLLLPRSRAQVAELLESLSPSQFHRLLFSRVPEANPPWADGRRLGQWSLVPTRLFKMALPKPPRVVRDRLRPLRVASRLLRLSVTWKMPEWELDLLARGDGRRPLAEVLRRIPLAVPFRELRRQLFLLYQLGAINLIPPAAARRRRPG
jgi:SAM-dependent methyltransferase